MDQRLVIFLKFPEAGKVKTRLARSIGEEQAACVYKRLVEDTLNVARPLAGKSWDVVVAWDPPEREIEIKKWIHGPFEFMPQGHGSLGERLSRAACAAFQGGAEKVVLIGSDCPDLDAFTLHHAFWALSRKDVVIGPSKDGGYYLIGLKHARDAFLFDHIPWSTPEVLAATLKKLNHSGVSYELLPEKSDVDTVEDLREKISVIIPVLNEEQSIEAMLTDLLKHHHPDEVIVVDGGSTDRTIQIASQYAQVVRSDKGRAVQMNAGAAAAGGDVLLFLHADTQLPKDALLKIQEALKARRANSGRFRMRFDHSHPLLRFSEYQTRFHAFSYGDQAFFVRKETFNELGGYDAAAPLEDIDFYRRLLKMEKPVIIPEPVITSARRFLQKGILRQRLVNMALAAMVYLGFKGSWVHHFRKLWYS